MRPVAPSGPSATRSRQPRSLLERVAARAIGRRCWLAAALSLLAGFGCKESKPEASSGSAPTPNAPASNEIVVGHYGSLTGNTAHFGQDTDKAIRLAIDEVNA